MAYRSRLDRVQRKRQKSHRSGFFLLIILLIAIGFGIKFYTQEAKNPNLTDVAQAQDVSVFPSVWPKRSAEVIPTLNDSASEVTAILDSRANLPINQQVNAVIQNIQSTFGIAVKSLNTDETFFLNENMSFLMASTYKTPLVLTSLIENEKGSMPDTTMIGFLPLKEADDAIITRSEEDFAELLANILGWQKVQQTTNTLGMGATDYTGAFTTTPKDQMTLYEDIYKGNNISPTVQKQIIGLLKNQQINDRIPRYLPNSVVVAHKTGDLDNIRHDVGFVSTGKTTYIIALMAKDVGTPQDVIDAEAQLSYVFYKYFTRK